MSGDIRAKNGYISVDKVGDDRVRLNVMNGTSASHVELNADNICEVIHELLQYVAEDDYGLLRLNLKQAIREVQQEDRTRALEWEAAVQERSLRILGILP
jgi:hypothetical protein